MKNIKLCGILFLCVLILVGCGTNDEVNAMKPEETTTDDQSSAISSYSENYFQSEQLSLEQDEIIRFFVGDDYHLFQYNVSEEYTDAVITAVHFQKGVSIAEKNIINYSLSENGNMGRLAVWDTVGYSDNIFTIGTDTMTQTKGESLADSYGIYADYIVPMVSDKSAYTVQAGEKYPFYLLVCGEKHQAESFEKIVKDPETELKNVEDCIIYYLVFKR